MDETQGENEGGSRVQWMKHKGRIKAPRGGNGKAMDETQGENEGGSRGAMDETQGANEGGWDTRGE